MNSRPQIRQQIISQRRNLSSSTQILAAKNLTHLALPLLARHQRLAFYMPARGEISSLLLLQHALTMQKQCYLPILHPLQHNKLLFMRYRAEDILIPNRYGILEPPFKNRHFVAAWTLDLVFTPLVAFDLQGNRLGMGGGYYDRTFAFLKNKFIPHPKLIGLAYEFQKVDELSDAAWDIPLDTIITEKNIYGGAPR